MNVQAHIPPVLCCIHNIICYYNPEDLRDCKAEQAEAEALAGGLVTEPGIYGEVVNGFITVKECDTMSAKQDEIADNLWQDHLDFVHNTQHVS